MNDSARNFTNALRQSALLRLLAIGFLIVILLIPVSWIGELTQERRQRRDNAVAEVAAKWGGEQTITGPALVIPYSARWTTVVERQAVVKTEVRYLTLLPDHLQIRARIEGQTRYRGIYAVPVYRLVLDVSGDFVRPANLAELDPELDRVDWSNGQLMIGVADARAIQGTATLNWGTDSYAFEPGAGIADLDSGGINAKVTNPFPQERTAFTFQVSVDGSAGLYFTAAGRETLVNVESDWPSPSFQGNWLPSRHSASAQGFSANWQIPVLGRNQPQLWVSTHKSRGLEKTRFGVDLLVAIEEHHMAERSVKYARLFLLLTFATIWLIEVTAHLRVHPIQYLLIGAAECIFYLLELSLAEQIGFGGAYALASLAIVALIGSYAAAVLHNRRRAVAVSGMIALLYLYLYVLLTNEDYALLFGSLGLFVGLSLTMFLTRRIDWYRIVEEPAAATEGT